MVCGVSVPLFPLYGQSVEISPLILYNGENVITIKSPKGIERVDHSSTRNIRIGSPTGFIRGCPDSVVVQVWVDSVSTDETLRLRVELCDGTVEQEDLSNRKWTIRHEYTGPVEVGADTCINCFVESTNHMFLDSISVQYPGLRVEIPALRGGHGKYQIRGGIRFPYRVCYRPERTEKLTATILLHFQRDFPSGGLNSYTIQKPITLEAVLPPPPPEPEKIPEPTLPALRDPTTFRNIVMPTAESPAKGRFFYGNFVVVGSLGGYGLSDRLSLLGGGVLIPDFIGPLYVGTLGLKYEFLRTGEFRAAAGGQVAFSSTEDSDIRTIAPYVVSSYGDEEHRLTAALGYGLKRHVTPLETFDRNALTLAIGGNTTVSRGWKIAAETYVIETSGIAPLLISARNFNNSFAFDFGLGIDLIGGSEIFFTNGLSGEIEHLAIAPFISAMWVF